MIKDILDRLRPNEGAMIVRPADTRDLAQCRKDLAEVSLPPLPADYISFLHQANGFAWNGIMFYSTDQVTDPETDFTLIDIVSANEDFQEHRDLPKKVLLGRSDMDLYTYDTETGVYEALDFTSNDQMDTFENFDALFTEIVTERMDED